MLGEIKLASYFRNAERFASSGVDDVNPVFVFFFIFISFALINLTSFSIGLMLVVAAISIFYSACTANLKRFGSSLVIALPFIAFFSASSFILTSEYLSILRASIFLATLTSLGSLALNLKHRKIISFLSFLKLPQRFSVALLIAIRLLNICTRDLANIIEIYAINERKRLDFYRKVVRVSISVFVLRAISLAESLYLRERIHSYSYNPLEVGIKELYFAATGMLLVYVYHFGLL
jgi:hypothetical protein